MLSQKEFGPLCSARATSILTLFNNPNSKQSWDAVLNVNKKRYKYNDLHNSQTQILFTVEHTKHA